MRDAFFKGLSEAASKDDRVMLVVGDLGFKVVDEYRNQFPDRFLNAGVAEQNMTSIAAGLALSGKTVFTYSIGNFPTLRCLEQIRNDVCYHDANVKIVAVGGGFSYGALGMSHHATEDLAIFRALPNITVLAPGDPLEVQHATAAIAATPGPCYLRLGRAGEKRVHTGPIDFAVGRALRVRDGSDVTLMSTGGMLDSTMQVAEMLRADGVSARVLSVHTLKPFDTESVIAAARETSVVITIEEHSILGGLGGVVAETLAEADISTPWRLTRIGLPSAFAKRVGGQEYLRESFGLAPHQIKATVDSSLQRARSRQYA